VMYRNYVPRPPRVALPDVGAEEEAFEADCRACAGSDTCSIYRAFLRWRKTLQPAERRKANDIAASLDAALFAGNGSVWSTSDSRSFIIRLDHVRRSHPAIKQPEKFPLTHRLIRNAMVLLLQFACTIDRFKRTRPTSQRR